MVLSVHISCDYPFIHCQPRVKAARENPKRSWTAMVRVQNCKIERSTDGAECVDRLPEASGDFSGIDHRSICCKVWGNHFKGQRALGRLARREQRAGEKQPANEPRHLTDVLLFQW